MIIMLSYPTISGVAARLGMVTGRNEKPSIIVATNGDIWIGNLTNSEMTIRPGELFGFGLGQYSEKVVRHTFSI